MKNINVKFEKNLDFLILEFKLRRGISKNSSKCKKTKHL